MDMDVAESGFDPAEGVPPQPGYMPPPGQPMYPQQPERPPKPEFGMSVPGGVAQPQHPGPGPLPPNQPWSGPTDTEGSGFGYDGTGEGGGGGSWNQGGPWQHPSLPSSNSWEPQQPAPGPVSQPHPQPGPGDVEGNYQWSPNFYPDQQGSGDGILPGPDAFAQPGQPPSPVEIITTTTTSLPTTVVSTTRSSSSTTTTPSTTTASTTTTTLTTKNPSIPESHVPFPSSVGENTRKVENTSMSPSQTSTPSPPVPPAPVGDFDDEDLGESPTPTTPAHMLPPPTERPWDSHQPVPPYETEVGRFHLSLLISSGVIGGLASG